MAPQYLYKYRFWNNDNHKRLLTHNELYFTSARKFNDPFDCTVPVRYDLMTREQALALYRKHLKKDNPQWSSEKIEQEAISYVEEGSYRDPKNWERWLDWQKKFKYRYFGIFSVTEVPDSILMWSHYADSHKGFCVGFDAEKLHMFRRTYWEETDAKIDHVEVEYFDDYPILRPCEKREVDEVKEQLRIKASDWKYEKEHRFILIGETKKKVLLPNGIVSEVILGCRMPLEHKDEIIGALRQRPTRIRLFQAKEKREQFGLDFQEIDY